MKDITQAFMKVLFRTNMQEKNIKAVTQLLWANLDGMDDLIAFIKDCPDADESEIMKEAVRISKRMDKDNPYRKALVELLHSINAEIPIEEKNLVLILYKLNTEDKIIKFNEWVKANLKEEQLFATEAEIVRAAVHISKEN